MEQSNFEKNQKFFVLNGFFTCWLLISEQILWLDIPWIHKTQHKATFQFLLGNWCYLNSVIRSLSKKLWKTSILEELAGCKKFSLHFNKIPNFFYEKFCRHIQKYAFFCVLKIVLQKQSVKTDLKVPGKSCDKIWCDEIHIVVNLVQKYEGELEY